jgi:gas vesicle protein
MKKIASLGFVVVIGLLYLSYVLAGGGDSFIGGFAGGTLGGVVGSSIAQKSSKGNGECENCASRDDVSRLERAMHNDINNMNDRIVTLEKQVQELQQGDEEREETDNKVDQEIKELKDLLKGIDERLKALENKMAESAKPAD